MEVNIVGIIALAAIVLIISIGLVNTFGGDLYTSIPKKIGDTFREIQSIVSPGGSYDVCEAYSGKTISLDQFYTILQAAYEGKCGSTRANYTLSFSLTKEEIKKLAKTEGIAKEGELILYRKLTQPLGMGAIIINGNPGYYPLKKYDYIQLWSEGTPDRDILIKVMKEGCDPQDDNCEVMCSYLEGVCDPLCYRDDKSEEVPCDFDCVDYDKNGIINISDRDGVCDLDCYNNITDPQNAYDIDCIWENREISDGICDPDTQGKSDGVCDPDCAKPNYICDFDCNGSVYEGNPKGLNDTDCYKCDGVCNGFCSYACKPKEDPDCPDGFKGFFNLTECCGNKKCGAKEDCETCPKDCPLDATCEDIDKVCCPNSLDSDEYGCSAKKNLNETDLCFCDVQCGDNLTCSYYHCCPLGTFWSGSENKCVNRTDVLIVALKTNLKKVYSNSQIAELENKIKEYQDALARDGLGSIFLYLDENRTAELTPGGRKVTNPKKTSDIDSVLDLLIPKLNVSYLVIIGGYSRFPQLFLGYERIGLSAYPIYSDNRYGDEDNNGILDVAVGRIPDPNRGDLNTMLNALDTAISLHNSGGLDLSNYQGSYMPQKSSGRWCSGVCFHKAVFGEDCSHDPRCVLRPDCSLREADGKKFFILLLHGSYEVPQAFACNRNWECKCSWTYGYFSPRKLRNINVKDAVWFMMCCSASVIANKPTTSSSIPLTFLKEGGAVYLGSACIAYGGEERGCPVPGGDKCIGSLYTEVAKKFSVGDTIGEAYLKGKNTYLKLYRRSSRKARYMYNINCFYGDPTLKIKKLW